jgi:hypothetical protein
MAHWICRAIASEREFMVFVMVLVAAATFLAIDAIAAWMSLVDPKRTSNGWHLWVPGPPWLTPSVRHRETVIDGQT